MDLTGFCVASGAGRSGFVDLQSNSSQYFLSFFSGIEYVSGYALYVGKISNYVKGEALKAARITDSSKRNKKIAALIKTITGAKPYAYGARLKSLKASLSALKSALTARSSKDVKKNLQKVQNSLNVIGSLGYI